MLRPIASSSVFDLSQFPNRFEPGLYSFGRASLLRQDMRVSRKQLDLFVYSTHIDVVQVRLRSLFLPRTFTGSPLASIANFALFHRLERISSASNVVPR